VPYINAPDLALTAINSTKCEVDYLNPTKSNARIDVSLTSQNTIALKTDYVFKLYKGFQTDVSGNPSGSQVGGTYPATGNFTSLFGAADNQSLTSGTFGPLLGDYIVEITDLSVSPACKLTNAVTLKSIVSKPLITIDNLIPNTACTPGAGDGQVNFTVTQDPAQLSQPVGPPAVQLLPFPLPGSLDYQITSVLPAPVQTFTNSIGNSSTQSKNLKGFYSDTPYTISIIENTSECKAEQIVVIPNQPDIPGQMTLNVKPENYCGVTPTFSNGSVLVEKIKRADNTTDDTITDYTFSYYPVTDPTLASTALYSAMANGTGTGGELFEGDLAKVGLPGSGWIYGASGFGNTQTYYVKATRTSGTTGIGCVAPIETAVIKDEHVEPVPVITTLPNTSCDPAAPEGSITIESTTTPGFLSTYSYDFVGTYAPPLFTGEIGTVARTKSLLAAGDYNVVITNELTACKAFPVVTIADSKFPVAITATADVNQVICNPDGSIRVTQVDLDRSAKTSDPSLVPPVVKTFTLSTDLTSNFDFNWFSSAPPVLTTANFGTVGSPLVDSGPATITSEFLSTANYPVVAGTYYVAAKKKTTEGRGCVSPPFLVTLKDVHQDPSVTITSLPNTSCDPTVGEGELKISVTDPLLLSSSYAYTWSPVVSSNGSAVSPANSVSNNGNQLADGDNDYVVGLLEGAYTVKVTSNQTNCFSNTTATLNLSQYPVSIVSANSVNQFICNPDGSIQLKEVKLDRRAKALDSVRYLTSPQITTNFDFNWFNTTPPTVTTANFGTIGSPLKDVGLATITSDVLSKSNFVTMKAGTYYAVGKKKTGEGLGCVSPPIEVKIQDKSIKPQLTFATVSNSACSPVFFDGQLTFTASDSTAAASAPKPYEYSYTWLSNPTDGISTPPSNNFGAVTAINEASTTRTNYKEGQYKIRLKNETTGCVLDSARTTILKNEVPVFVKSVKTIDQLYCSQLTGGVYVPVKSGNSVVTSVTYTDRAGATITPTTPQLTSEFTYQWTDSLNNVLASNIRLDSLSANGKGRYFVTATRNNSLLPGSGCPSAPFRVNIQDNRQYPTVSFSTLPQTICDNRFEIFDGKITAKPATSNIKYLVYDSIKSKTLGSPVYDTLTTKYFAAQNPTYDLDWTNPSQPVGAVFSPLIKTNLAVYNSATQGDIISTGTYSVLVTNRLNGCTAKQASTVFVDKITPDIAVLDVDVKHQFDCAPFDGSLAINGRDAKYVSLPAIASETYTFDWYNGNYTPGIPGSVGPPVVTAVPPVPTGSSFISVNSTSGTPNAIVSSLNAASYHVVATKKGGKGSGCFSIPYPVVLRDSTQKPAIDTKSIANYACLAALGNGSISATVNDGTKGGEAVNDPAKFTFQWSFDRPATSLIPNSKNGNQPTAINLPDGTYFVTATDQASPFRGCVNTVSGVIDFQKTEFTSSFTFVAQMKCPPLEDGSLTVVEITEEVPGLVPSKTYSMATAADRTRFDFEWFDDKSAVLTTRTNGANVLSNRVAGSYFTRFTNTLGCSSSNQGGIVLDNTAKPVISLDNFSNPTVCLLPAKTGSLQVSADGNLNFSDYTFQWLRGASLADPEVVADNPDLSGILFNDPLTYTVKVTNKATRCFSKETYKLAIDTIAIRAIASAVPLSNCVSPNGVLFGATADGIGNLYRFDWYNGTTATGTPVFANQKQITTAPLGTYTVKATVPDPAFSFCPSFPATISVEDARVYPVPITEQIAPLTFCEPSKANGVARVSVAGEVRGYNFDWYEGAITTPIIYSGAEAQGLKAVLYTAKATDIESGCFGTKTITIEDKKRVTPPPTVVVLSDRTNCVVPDGTLTASVKGEVQGYTFRWSDGRTAKVTPDYDKSEFYRDLDAGFYTTVAVEDISGCISAPVITEIKLAQVLPDFDVETKPTNCEQNIGEAKYIPLNDVLISSITWDIGGITQVGAILSDLPKGIFKVTATSDRSCVLTKSIQILPEILVFNGISNNNDGQNEVFDIACIQDFPNNQVKIFNRQGTIVYQAKGYDNRDVAFSGFSNEGVSLLGTELPGGTYFYIIDKGDGSTPRSGYLELVR
jgi:hypothetical protein